MQTTILAFTVAVLLLVSNALADETGPSADVEARDAAGVWYGFYTKYPGRDFAVRPRAGSDPPRWSFIPNSWETASSSEPIFVVLDLQSRDEEVVGTLTMGRGIRYEDPRASMKRLFDIPLRELRLPESFAVEGSLEDTQLALAVPAVGNAEPVITAEVDADRMRAKLLIGENDVRIARLNRCNPEKSADGLEATAEATAGDVCTVEAVWQRLSEEQGRGVDPNRSSSASR